MNLLKSLYDGSLAAIKTDHGISRFVNIQKGVKQGDIVSAILFCFALSAVILKTEDNCNHGYSIGGQIISNLAYADDIAVTNSDIKLLQHFIDNLTSNAKEIRLEINLKKTVSMPTDNTQPKLNICIYRKSINQVNEFVYLGYKLSSSNNQEVAMKQRIGLGWAAFAKHENSLKSKRIPINIKTRIYETYILPVVLYSLDCITWNTKLSQKIIPKPYAIYNWT